jgi:hypothetical protein
MNPLSNAEHQKLYRQRRNERAKWADTVGAALEATLEAICRARPGIDAEHFKGCLEMKFESTTDWRQQKVAEYPDDVRNTYAAEILERLGNEVHEMSSSHILFQSYAALYEAAGDDNGLALIETESEFFRRIGFHSNYDDATEMLGDLVGQLAAEVRRHDD